MTIAETVPAPDANVPTASTPESLKMRLLVKSLPVLMAGIVIGFALSVGQIVLADKESPQLPLKELKAFTEIFAKIKSDYVEDITDDELLESAIEGMVAGLDPHSAYLRADDYRDLQQGTSGEFGGLGIEVGMEDGFVKVIAPIDDTPAQRAGIEAGDLIIRLDDTPVKGMTLSDAVKIMRGKPGTIIVLTVVRDGRDSPFTIEIERDRIRVTSVKQRSLAPGFGYVRITQFQTRTGENLRDAIDKLKSQNDGKLEGLVLDLRNNPGGVLSAAVSVSDAFLTEGLIVYTDGRLEDSKLEFEAKPNDMIEGAPIVVLVNGGSASASEIVAGALQDHKRAVIMGAETFGKGSVQTILPMDNGAALKLTTARYYTPGGRSIQAKGIVPDIIVDRLRVSQVASKDLRISEKDLSGHLEDADEDAKKNSESGSPNSSEAEPKTESSASTNRESLASRDYALYEALNLLKGLSILKKG